MVILASDDAERAVLAQWILALGATPATYATLEQALVAPLPIGFTIVSDPRDQNGVAVAIACLRKRLICPIFCIAPETADPAVLFASGVDEFVKRPYDVAELLNRVARFIRSQSGTRHQLLSCGPIVVDTDSRAVFVSGKELLGKRKPTRKEFDLLVYFIKRKEKVVEKQAIVRDVLDGGNASVDNAKAPVCLLRAKLGQNAARYLETVRAVGFKMTERPKES